MSKSKKERTAGWLLLTCIPLLAGPGSALAQDTTEPPASRGSRLSETHQRLREADANLERRLFRAAIEGYEEVLEAVLALRVTDDGHEHARRLQRWEERAELQIATARIRQHEPALARRRLQDIAREERFSAGARRRARQALSAMETQAPVRDDTPTQDGPFDLDVGTALIVTFGVIEAVLLSVGIGLLAAEWCEDPPGFMLTGGCDRTAMHVGIGLAVAGSVWWIVPAVIGGFMNRARRGSIGTPHPKASLGPTLSF